MLRANRRAKNNRAQRAKETANRLKKAGINPNWIDKMLGHQLVNSRDAYSLPTDEELAEAYRTS
jgi:hypothetical protein